MLHLKADMERVYILRKNRGRGRINVETAFKIATIGFDHYLKHKDASTLKILKPKIQYPKLLLNSKGK